MTYPDPGHYDTYKNDTTNTSNMHYDDYYNNTNKNDTYYNDTSYEPYFAGNGSNGTMTFSRKFDAKTNQWLRLMVCTYAIVVAYTFKYAVVA